jgi:hypothetical protein
LRPHEQLEKELLEMMASPTEQEITARMREYTNSLSVSEMEYATSFLRNRHKANKAALAEALRMVSGRGSTQKPLESPYDSLDAMTETTLIDGTLIIFNKVASVYFRAKSSSEVQDILMIYWVDAKKKPLTITGEEARSLFELLEPIIASRNRRPVLGITPPPK